MRRVWLTSRLGAIALSFVAWCAQADTPPAIAPVAGTVVAQADTAPRLQVQAGGAGPDNPGWLRRHWGRFVAQAHFDRAWRLQRENRLEEAEQRFAQGLSIDPLHQAARLDHARLLARLGRIAQARQAYERVLARAPGDVAVSLELVDLLAAHDEPQAALELLESLPQVLQSRPAHLMRAAHLAQRLDNPERALSYTLAAAEHGAVEPHERRQALESAFQLALDLGRFAAARDALEAMAGQLEEDVRLRRLYLVSLRAGDDKAALSDATVLLERVHEQRERLRLLDAMVAHARRAQDSQAELEALTRALVASERAPSRWRDLIAWHVRAGDQAVAAAQALALARHSGQTRDRDAAASLVLGNVRASNPEPIAQLETLALAAADTAILMRLAETRLKLGDSDRALALFEVVASTATDKATEEYALRAVAHLHGRSGNAHARGRALEVLAQRLPTDREVRIARAEALLDAGEASRAADMLRGLAAREAQPRERAALQLRLVDALRLGADPAAERDALHELLDGQPLEPAPAQVVLARLAQLHAAAGEHERAADLLAMRLSRPGLGESERFSVARDYALALYAAQRWREAADQFEWLHESGRQAHDGWHAMRALLAAGDRPQALLRAERLASSLEQWHPSQRQAFLAEYGQLLADAGRSDEAIEQWEQALTLGEAPDILKRRNRLLAERAVLAGTRALSAGEVSAALEHYEQAETLMPQAVTSESLAYAQLAAGQPARAAASLEQALARDSSRTWLLPQLGYAWLGAGEADKARQSFTAALLAQRSDGRVMPDDQAEQLRRELRELNRRWSLAFYQSARGQDGRTLAAPGGQGAVLPSAGGVEIAYRLDPPGGAAPRELSLLARGTWSQPDGGLRVAASTAQGAFGVRWQPIAGSGLRLGLERLVAFGDDARDDWLARVGWSWAQGYEVEPTRRSWWTTQTWLDAGWFARNGGSRALYGEARLGRSQSIGDGWVLMPHAVVNGRALAPDPRGQSWLEAGFGVSLRREFGATALQAARGRLELTAQWKQAIEPGRRDTWVLGMAVTW